MDQPTSMLTLREAADLKKPAPYTYGLTIGSQRLFMFGAAHFKPATDPQFQLMQSMWDEFKALGSSIALVETGVGAVGESFERAVTTDGEAGATVWLGLRDGVGALCADMEYKQLLASLVEQFDAGDIAYWVIAREMDIFYRNPGTRSAEEMLTMFLTRYTKRFSEIGISSDRTWFDAKHAQVSGGKAVDDKEYWELANSWNASKVFVDIVEAESRIRNERILGVIVRLLNLGRNVFVTYGATHAIQLEPALRALATK